MVPDSTSPGFAFITNVVSVSNTSNIEIILLLRPSLIKKGLTYVIIFTHSNVLCYFIALFFASRGYN